VKVAGTWTYLYRAVDQHGQVIDVLLSARRDLAAARRFFTRALRAGTIPAEVTTDRAPVYPRVLDELVPSARLRQWPVGDNDQLVPGGRVAVPAVRGVEQVTADHRHLDGVPEGLDVILAAPARGGRHGRTCQTTSRS
jgi:transposase-like protein